MSVENTEIENAGVVEDHSEESVETSKDEAGTQNSWEDAFPGKSPQEVAQQIEEWKSHSREWEKRAKGWKKQTESTQTRGDSAVDTTAVENEYKAEIQEYKKQLSAYASENLMFKDLIALEIETGAPVPISSLADSMAFRDAYNMLDREEDDFAEKLKTLVEKRGVKHSRASRVYEVAAEKSSGIDLYQRMFNPKEN
ncbi:hypothetical protein ACXM2N_03480 [Corynebacterium sp. ZY180755]